MPNQYNAARFAEVPQIVAPSDEDAQASNKVIDLGGSTGDAAAKLNTRPTPGSGLFFGTAATTARSIGLGAWNAGQTTVKKVIDRDDAPVKLNVDPNLSSDV